MSSEVVVDKIVAVIGYKAKREPRYYYQSEVLRYYTPYIAYYKTVPTDENLKNVFRHLLGVLSGSEKRGMELIMFSMKGADKVVQYAKSLGCEIHYMEQKLRKLKRVEAVPVMVFHNKYLAMRHLLFALSYARVRNVSKADKIWDVVDELNINMVETLYNTALFRYNELRMRKDPRWYGKLLRIGRAFRIMYMIDKR